MIRSNRYKVVQRGFTVIELMIVVTVIAVLAVLALPAYKAYVVRGGQSEAESQMATVSALLASHRSKNFNYNQFSFLNVGGLCGSATCSALSGLDASSFTLPLGESVYYRYKVTLVDLATRKALTDGSVAASQSWLMLATPNTNNPLFQNAGYLLLTSDGVKCKSADAVQVAIATVSDCGAAGSDW